MVDILVKNARIVDGTTDVAKDAVDIRLADGHVQEVGCSLTAGDNSHVIDAREGYVMPGLIDAHVHVLATMANLKQNALLPVISFALGRIF